ncbi:MAG: sodium:solute symporter family transporter, partial [Acidobacteriaceae bacterium]
MAASFLAVNCGALEVVGLSAMAAEFGVRAFQFYWIGAIPAMVVLAIWVMPAYIKSGIRSVPEYLENRFGIQVRLLNAYVLAVTMLMLAGISLYALAEVLQVVLHLNFALGASLSAAVVLTYVLLGGIRATIYNEVFQLVVMVAGLVPLTVRSYRYAMFPQTTDTAPWHLWKGTPLVSLAAPFDVLSVVVGLGFVLSFGYWCTDFVMIQRALTARTESEARQVPLWAGFGKLGFSLIVVLPGLAAHRLLPSLAAQHRFDRALPAMMTAFYGPTLLGLGLTALTASLMSGLAANISAFAAIWTEDIYRTQFVRGKQENHYLRIGKWATVIAIAVS